MASDVLSYAGMAGQIMRGRRRERFVAVAALIASLVSSPAAGDDSADSGHSPIPILADAQMTRGRERALLGPGGRAAIYAIADAMHPFDAARSPLLVVHGLTGNPGELAAIFGGLRDRFQPYVLVYDDLGRRTGRCGDEFAAAMSPLARGAWRNQRILIVAHSLGGIVARRALNRMALDRARPLDATGGVHVIAIDSPWHGYPGPADNAWMALARPMMPDGIEDLRARSALFAGDPASADLVERAGLFGVELPPAVEIELVFAVEGDEVLDYTESILAELPARMKDWYAHDIPVRGEPRLLNFWRALRSSAQYTAFCVELEPAIIAGRLDVDAVRGALRRHFPRYPGDHMGVLAARPDGLVSALAARLNPRGRGE